MSSKEFEARSRFSLPPQGRLPRPCRSLVRSPATARCPVLRRGSRSPAGRVSRSAPTPTVARSNPTRPSWRLLPHSRRRCHRASLSALDGPSENAGEICTTTRETTRPRPIFTERSLPPPQRISPGGVDQLRIESSERRGNTKEHISVGLSPNRTNRSKKTETPSHSRPPRFKQPQSPRSDASWVSKPLTGNVSCGFGFVFWSYV